MDWLASGTEVEEDNVDASQSCFHLPEGSTANPGAAAEKLATRIA